MGLSSTIMMSAGEPYNFPPTGIELPVAETYGTVTLSLAGVTYQIPMQPGLTWRFVPAVQELPQLATSEEDPRRRRAMNLAGVPRS